MVKKESTKKTSKDDGVSKGIVAEVIGEKCSVCFAGVTQTPEAVYSEARCPHFSTQDESEE